ncbi:MAG: hypothetical protein IE931_03275 [Sphingobacteriales bacterium]|nr:hypothetical protein [Sphingobacteriales bacterium]
MITSLGALLKNSYFEDATSNVFLGIYNNLWSNPQNWSYGHVPTDTERARIHHYCVQDVANAACDELYVDSGYTLDSQASKVLYINSIVNYGTVNITTTNSVLNMLGDDTRNTTWGTINFGIAGTMAFSNNNGTLTIPILDYYTLVTGYNYYGSAGRNISAPLTIRGNFRTLAGNVYLTANVTVNGVVDCSTGLYVTNCSLINYGTFTVYNSYSLYLNNAIIEAYGLIDWQGLTGVTNTGINTVNCRAGLTIKNYACDWSNIDFIFKTNNQSIGGLGSPTVKSLTIEGNITVTNNNTGSIDTPTINGTTSTSQLINKGVINYTGSATPMLTGILDCGNFSNTFNYQTTSSINLAPTDYWNLTISSLTGTTANTKTFTRSTIIYGNFIGEDTCNLSYTGYSLTVNGTTILRSTAGFTYGYTQPSFKTTGSGILTLKGLLSSNAANSFSLTGTGNIIEFQGGWNLDGYPNISNALVKFTTNNQTVSHAGTTRLIINNCEISNITLTMSGGHVDSGLTVNGTITGTGTAVFKTINTSRTDLNGATPFSGITHDSNSSAAKTIYQRNGSQSVAEGTYGGLTLSGTATPNDKTLQGNVSVLGTYAVTGNAVKVDNGFTFSNP